MRLDRRGFLGLAPAALLAGCGGKSEAGVKLALNWKPDPQFGGFYAAEQLGLFQKEGLTVEILPGGAGTPTVQMVGAGSAEFGIVSGDEIVLGRSRGNDVVGLFAVFQNCPQGLMVRASRKLATIGDLFAQEGTVALQKGLPYARLLEKKYGFAKVRVVPSPGGDITAFLADEKMAQQCFVMSEPLTARRQGVEVRVFPVSDTGYNPYTTVLAASGALVRERPELARKMVAAVRAGWRAYLDNPAPVNARMRALNPSMDEAVFAEVAAAQKSFIETEETRTAGLGAMKAERWAALGAALEQLGDVEKAPPAGECFRAL